jgi:hypothetical protein
MNAGIRVIWYDAAGVQIAPTFIQGTYATLTNTDGWQRRTFTGVAPANAVSVRTYLGQITGGTAGQTFLIDAVLIEKASSALPYFDGTYVNDYTGYTVSSKAWNGTENNSPSTVKWNPNVTVGDLANKFWSDPDTSVFNLELEDGNDLLLEDGTLMLLEAGNV